MTPQEIKLTSGDITNLLHAKHPAPEWASFPELRDAAGFGANRSFDFWTINTWPSKGLRTVGYEIKISRSDFARELSNPRKRKSLEEVCHECYFAAPKGVIDPRELPEGWGLIEASTVLRIAVRAPQKAEPAISWDLMAVVLRRAREQVQAAENRLSEVACLQDKHSDPEAYIRAQISSRLEGERARLKSIIRQDLLGEEFGENLSRIKGELLLEGLPCSDEAFLKELFKLIQRARKGQAANHGPFMERSVHEMSAKLDKMLHLLGESPGPQS